MKWIACLLLIGQNLFATPNEISGVVTLPKALESMLTPNGALFIIARPAGMVKPGTPPIAAQRIAQPKFPQKFSIGPKDSMMGGSFDGEITVTARYTKTGDALDKTGPEGSDAKNMKVKLGKENLKIELKEKK